MPADQGSQRRCQPTTSPLYISLKCADIPLGSVYNGQGPYDGN